MNKKIIKALSLALVAFMLFAMGAVCMVSAEETAVITNSLGAYPYPYPLEGNRLEYCGWNMRTNTANSVWYNDSENSFYNIKAATNGYTDANGVAHPYGVGMHSAINYAPSTVYSIDNFKMTSFKTTVYLVQYDMADEEGLVNIDPTAEQLAPVVVYIDLAKPDEETGNLVWTQADEETGEKTYPVEKTLTKKDTAGEDNSVVLEVNEAVLSQYTHIRIGIKTKHGIYEIVTEGEGEEAKEVKNLIGNTALASVYFADLEITQSEAVPVITAPSIPTRPTTDPAQDDVYEEILPPEADEANWYGKPYGAWMAGSNDKYFLSDMTYIEASNTPNTSYAQGQPTTINGSYGKPGTGFLFGAEGMEHEIENGISMHPKNPKQPVIGRTDSWTIYDISEYTEDGADTFYTLVGLIAGSDNWGSRLTSAGVYVYIYGDKTGDGEHYELLAASELVKGYNLGEFNVNVEGVKLLLIDVILPETATSHGYSGVGFGNACLFTADADAEKPDYTGDMPVDDEEWDGEEEDDVTTTTKPTTTKPTTPSTTDDAEDEKSGLGVGAIVAIVAGVVVVIAIAAVIVITKRKPNVAATAETTVETAGTENNENDGSNSDNT
jgi:hypothetical protein